MSENISAVVDAAQTIIDATDTPSSPPSAAVVAQGVAEGVAEGVVEAAKLLQSDEEYRLWQAETHTKLDALYELVGAGTAALLAALPSRPEIVAVEAPAAIASDEVAPPEVSLLELPEEVPEAAVMPEVPIATPQLHPTNKGKRTGSQRRWL